MFVREIPLFFYINLCITLSFNCYFLYKELLPIEGPSKVAENMQEEQPDDQGAMLEEHEDHQQQQQQQKQKEQIQKILANVRQNFGKINVAPEFNEEDMVPVEMPDLDMSDFSDSDDDKDSEEEEDGEEDRTNVEPADEETEESEPTTSQAGKANSNKSSREVIRELDEKIAKYKQFLDRAKSKHFSAIRSVCSRQNLTHIYSFNLWSDTWPMVIMIIGLVGQWFTLSLLFGQDTKGTVWESIHRSQG